MTGNEGGSDAERFSFVRRWRLDERQKDAAFLQNLPRTLLSLIADWIKHDVDVVCDIFEALCGVVDRFVRAELAQHAVIL